MYKQSIMLKVPTNQRGRIGSTSSSGSRPPSPCPQYAPPGSRRPYGTVGPSDSVFTSERAGRLSNLSNSWSGQDRSQLVSVI